MNLSEYSEVKPKRLRRIVWRVVNATLFRSLPGKPLWPLRRAILQAFGAEVSRDALIYAQCRIFAPWNLKIGRVCIGPRTEIYNKDMVTIGDDTVISQGAFICTASHDISSLMLPLQTRPITIGNHVWVAADAFIGPGVKIGDGAVVAARSAVFEDVESWTVVRGNPATPIRQRKIK